MCRHSEKKLLLLELKTRGFTEPIFTHRTTTILFLNCCKVITSKASPVNSLPQNSHLTLRLGQSCCRCSGRSRRVSLTLQRLGHGITLNAQVEKWLCWRKQGKYITFQSHKTLVLIFEANKLHRQIEVKLEAGAETDRRAKTSIHPPSIHIIIIIIHHLSMGNSQSFPSD